MPVVSAFIVSAVLFGAALARNCALSQLERGFVRLTVGYKKRFGQITISLVLGP